MKSACTGQFCGWRIILVFRVLIGLAQYIFSFSGLASGFILANQLILRSVF